MLHTIPLGIVSSTASAYLIEQSLLFNDDDSAYLNRTPSTAGNRKTWTWSGWVKRANIGAYMHFICAGPGGADFFVSRFGTTNKLELWDYSSSTDHLKYITTAVFNDSSAWYHIVFAVDTTQATASNRVKIYVNGVQVTAFDTETDPSLNFDTHINSSSYKHEIGALTGSGANVFTDGLMALPILVDGSALAPSAFGETDADGFWNPIEYTGSFGTNGFQLNFEDTSAFGNDTSGNNNDYTPNNFTASDQLEDSPTSSSDEEIGNYATLNPNDRSSGVVLADGNLKGTIAPSAWNAIRGTIGAGSGKVYFEVTDNNGDVHNSSGMASAASILTNSPGTATQNSVIMNVDNYTTYGGSDVSSTSSTAGQIRGHAFDLDAGKAWYAINNTWQNSGNPSTAANPIDSSLPTDGTLLFPVFRGHSSSALTFNFGQKAFAYTPPTGFVALATQNLPEATIPDGSLHMNTVIYTGNGTAIGSGGNAITGVGFQPDFVWIKGRDTTFSHQLYDVIRGAEKPLNSNNTGAEGSNTEVLTAFTSDGFTVGSNNGVNQNTKTYVGWCWKAGGSASSNTDGSITTNVSANTTSGFSIISYTGTGASYPTPTIGHGLGSAPKFCIIKNRGQTDGWAAFHDNMLSASNPWNDNHLRLDTTAAVSGALHVSGAAPTSSIIYLDRDHIVNASSEDYICYAWSEVEGFSKFGSYTGNGSADGPFVYTGFRPAFVMTKRTNSTGDWRMHDTARVPYNPFTGYLRASTTEAELSGGDFDFLSNGFKIRNNGGEINASGGAFIYMAFAEHPFQGGGGVTQARAR